MPVEMEQRTRSALTLLVLCLLLAVGALWGWSAVSKPFPGKADAAKCVSTVVKDGDKVYPDQVTVSLFNAGRRSGLAGRTMQLLTDKGFAQGDMGNAPPGTKVRVAEIWTTEPKSPAVRLVASRLGKGVRIVHREPSGAGVVVLVGDGFTKLVRGQKFVLAHGDTEICSPSL